jgi:hypothetical protein
LIVHRIDITSEDDDPDHSDKKVSKAIRRELLSVFREGQIDCSLKIALVEAAIRVV